ncbi:hypothetical protein CC78DRAFT_153403 [Lojkania enalia]|uniref:Uncharacterized protein n=1 Tax=Lojkania enalia TaxID=147567 RepID=A0A9P4KEB0_9PLEO|nr:hypothetical protein CC78DRAFT_153403 [Didymosphaeria enalia]
MGNAQSTGHQHRLSKPKTNTNSPFSTPVQNTPVSVHSKYADFGVRERQQLKEQLTSPAETEFGSGILNGEYEKMGELATHVQARLSNLSRSNSAASQRMVDLDTAIKLIQEIRKTASPEDLAALHQALTPSGSPVPSKDLSSTASVINRSTSSLIRRRSLVATPGVATRGSPTDGKRRTWNSWKTPQPDPREAKWKVEMMGASPLARLASLDLAEEEGRESPAPRARTPGDMDYSHLGTLKLGSLVVTNGAASPAPSARKIIRQQSNPHMPQEEDYFTASEGRASPTEVENTRKRAHSRSKSSTLPLASPLYSELRVLDETQIAKSTSRYDSSLRTEMHSNDLANTVKTDQTRPRHQAVSQNADTLAKDYMAEIPSSPFHTLRHESSPHSDEGYAESPLDDAASFRDEAFRILNGTIFNDSAAAQQNLRPEPKPTPSPKISRRKKDGRPTPRKADSGYSSGGSFRVAQHEVVKEGTASILSKKGSVSANSSKSGNGSDNDDAASLYTFEQMLALPISKKPLPPIPTDEKVESRPSHLQVPESTGLNLDLTESPASLKSPSTPKSLVSHFTIDSKTSAAQKRLQKRRPSMPSLPVVQTCQPVTEGTIPSVPDNIRAKFVRRLSQSPAMECLTHTYPSKDHEDTAKSVADSASVVLVEFPYPSDSPEPRSRRHVRSQTERPPTPPPHGFRRSLSLFRSKQELREKHESNNEGENNALDVVDLGTVAMSLGSSPYDAAMPVLPRDTVTSPTHPHQLGYALPRAKSMVNMDAKTAAEVARMRSKDRAFLCPEFTQRPRSYHEKSPDAGEATASKRRPHSSHGNVPPVPSVERQGLPDDYDPSPRVELESLGETRRGSSIRARSTGRGPMVSQLVDKYDKCGEKLPASEVLNWESHARLWSQRRKSIGEGLRQRLEISQTEPTNAFLRASSQPPENLTFDRYSGGLDYGFERGYGISGSAGTRVLHSAASRKSMPFSSQYGVDLSDVPVFVQRNQVQHF